MKKSNQARTNQFHAGILSLALLVFAPGVAKAWPASEESNVFDLTPLPGSWGDALMYFARESDIFSLTGSTGQYEGLAVVAKQRPGTTLVDITYQITQGGIANCSLQVAVSSSDGVTFDTSPSAASLSGDLGPISDSGLHSMTWNAAQTLSGQTFGANFRVRIVGTSGSTVVRGVSPRFDLDLAGLGAGLVVQGRVLSGGNKSPLMGATVTIGAKTATTGIDGRFSITGVSLVAGNNVTIAKVGFATFTSPIQIAAGTKQTCLEDIVLPVAAAAGTPMISGVQLKIFGIFLGDVGGRNQIEATVDWNEGQPGVVQFYANGVLVGQASGSATKYTAEVDMRDAFTPSFTKGANKVTVIARSAAGAESEPGTLEVKVIPLTGIMEFVHQLVDALTPTDALYLREPLTLGFAVPPTPLGQKIFVPGFGYVGATFQARGDFEYAFASSEWKFFIGAGYVKEIGKPGARPVIPGLTREPKMGIYFGNREIEGSLQIGAHGVLGADPDQIIAPDLLGKLEIAWRGELTRFGLINIPGVASLLPKPFADALKPVSLILYGKLSGAADVTVGLTPNVQFKTFRAEVKPGLELAYEIDKPIKFRIYGGGDGTFVFKTPGAFFDSGKLRIFLGAYARAWLFNIGPEEFVLVEWTLYDNGLAQPVYTLVSKDGDSLGLSAIEKRPSTSRVMDRPYLSRGLEGFVAGDLDDIPKGRARKASLERFRNIGKSHGKGTGQLHKLLTKDGPQLGPPPIGSELLQENLLLCTNVFPEADPAMASWGQDLMLLYVTDNGSTNRLQFTDIRWTRWDGTNWSTPQTLHTNTQSEFAPRVAYDGNGDAVAVWERVADPNFQSEDVDAMAAQMEIVWAKWNHVNGQWSEPAPITSNLVLDHKPQLVGPLQGGKVLLTWIRNDWNLLVGTNNAGSQIMASEWDPLTISWSPSQVIASNLTYQLSESLAGATNRAVYVWSRDLDGQVTNANDQQVFCREWTNGTWAAIKQVTTNNVGNQNARAAVSPSGDLYLLWQRGTNLVMNQNFAPLLTVVRDNALAIGMADYTLTFSPVGNPLFIWQEMSQQGSDAHYAIYDPDSQTWSKDAALLEDPALERAFAPAWDNVGNLALAYNKIEIVYTNKSVMLSNGVPGVITNIPMANQVDLAVTKRRLVSDLALLPGSFTVIGENYLPGSAVTLSAQVKNAGNLAFGKVNVGFYDGDPFAGGVLITNIMIPGWLEGAATNTATAVWIIPEPATNHTVYALVNSNGFAAEFCSTNNQQSISIGGVDLSTSLAGFSVLTNGSLRVIAQVHNIGAPAATNFAVTIRRAGVGGTNAVGPVLATVDMPLLEPGRLAQSAIELPAGTQPEGQAFYQLQADPAGTVRDVYTNNNTAAFAVNLWIDSDNDGMPDSWETANGLNPMDPADALLDNDHDGLNNLVEYRAGTNPNDLNSYLVIESIAAAAGGGGWAQLTWGSVSNRLYSVERSSDLLNFTAIAERILATPPVNTYLDTTATNAPGAFYRIRLE